MPCKILAALIALLLFTGCLGPNRATNSVRNWNAELAEADWVNEVVFIGFHIVPVYWVAYVGDVLVFNTMGYWAENPLNEPGPFPGGFHAED